MPETKMKPYTPEQLKKFTDNFKRVPQKEHEFKIGGLMGDNPFADKQIENLSKQITKLSERIKALEGKNRPSIIIQLNKQQVDNVLKSIMESEG